MISLGLPHCTTVFEIASVNFAAVLDFLCWLCVAESVHIDRSTLTPFCAELSCSLHGHVLGHNIANPTTSLVTYATQRGI